jgi:hypothetical protein
LFENRVFALPASICALSFFAFTFCLLPKACAQADAQYYTRKNSFGVVAAYSNDSSHILLGDAENRKLLGFGASYSRRLFLNGIVNWQYDGEFFPVALESDPLTKYVNVQTAPVAITTTFTGLAPMVTCAPVVINYSYTVKGVTYSGTATTTCTGRQWTPGEAFSPIGMQWNFRPRHRLQSIVSGHGGEMYTTKPIPVPFAGSFNFTFDVGAGFEYFRTKTSSLRVEYKYHHASNHETASENPGIDNGVLQFSWVFGR